MDGEEEQLLLADVGGVLVEVAVMVELWGGGKMADDGDGG